MEAKDIIGWASSLILVVTVGRQVFKQWQEGSSEGVSTWLFVGQLLASCGLAVYSWMVQNWVFVVTNALMMLNALIGFGITLHFKRAQPAASENESSAR